jgi:hypothetical protein
MVKIVFESASLDRAYKSLIILDILGGKNVLNSRSEMTTDSSFLFNINAFASSTSSSTTSSLISTVNSYGSNTSSNSSSFIQLTNDTDDQQAQKQSITLAPSPVSRYKFLLNAYVNGFVQLKLCADKIDYEYIIELYWSNNLKTFIKRTYEDFVLFHRKLVNEFDLNGSHVATTNKNKFKLMISNTNSFDKTSNSQKEIPTLSGKSMLIPHLQTHSHMWNPNKQQKKVEHSPEALNIEPTLNQRTLQTAL